MKVILKTLVLLLLLIMIFSVLLTSCAPVEPGTVWHYGTEEPGEALAARVGDFYMKTDSGDVYVLEDDGWNKLAHLNGKDGKDGVNGKDGENGKDGTAWLYGTAAPAETDGEDGDFWLDTNTLKMYKKADGAWSLIADFKE